MCSELGGHLDGNISTQAHTVICSTDNSSENPVTGSLADAICAAYFANEIVLRMMRPGTTSIQIRQAIQLVAKAFACTPIDGPCVFLTKRFVNCSAQKMIDFSSSSSSDDVETPSGDGQEWHVLPGECYTINIRMTSGLMGKTKIASVASSVFQRNVLQREYQLRLPSSRSTFSYVNEFQSVFPFSIAQWDAGLRAGLQECWTSGLIEEHAPVRAASRSAVAQFKSCVWVAEQDGQQSTRSPVTGLTLPHVRSEFQLPTDLAAVMAQPGPKSIKTKLIDYSVSGASHAPMDMEE